MTNYDTTAKAELLYYQGNVNARSGLFEDALSLYEQAIALDGNNPMYYNNRSAALKRLGRFQDAIKQYEEIVQKFPDYGKAFLSIASTSIETGDYQGAVSSYRRFFEAYKKGDFTFNPIVGGINQSVYGDDLLETALITSINYLSEEQKRLAMQAFVEAQP
ncbi:Tetratricopeptide TPR_2 repeat-containing protein [Crinalium epipsammum PCC 9333]|uniref:Tetratricopeptide TPR_2 repeat-containing protein n=2 Tax=Crinalium TaxID=241421 RepID=K9W476_9CYAN|nr:Tetratricopeptide TPR_2 repeat-containing protein [Crinalium epipsammum PCC 9333]